MSDHWITWGEDVPGRDDDWPALAVTGPERCRELARWSEESAIKWEASGRPELAREAELRAASLRAQAEAIEADDRETLAPDA